ncbi:MAG: hypothetical protein HFI42_07790 [Lachnospiraceae bacterium]|nr:hypothetical protein [Lachnospiraceae bacterium]MCI9150391.1 hypothetical protein [Lachnospiraceae bacterium]
MGDGFCTEKGCCQNNHCFDGALFLLHPKGCKEQTFFMFYRSSRGKYNGDIEKQGDVVRNIEEIIRRRQ